jgi:hypothetical protein
MNNFVQACNDRHIGNIASHAGVLSAPFTMLVWPTNGRSATRTHYKNYGHAVEAFRELDMENVSKVHIYDNGLHCLVKCK